MPRFTWALFAIGVAGLVPTLPVRAEQTVSWRTVKPGLDLAVVDAPMKSIAGDSQITLVRVEPERFALKLIAAKQQGDAKRTAVDWARRHGLLVAINAGMFLTDHRTSVGYMKSGGEVLQPRMARDYNAVLAFDPISNQVPAAQVVDIKCANFASLKSRYRSMVQSLRMIDCKGRNRWGRDSKRWSVAVIASDTRGRLLFIHSRSPYTMRDFADILLGLGLGIRTTIYLEGGPEATLYLKAGLTELVRVGSYETGFNENDDNKTPWPLPNVIGVVPR